MHQAGVWGGASMEDAGRKCGSVGCPQSAALEGGRRSTRIMGYLSVEAISARMSSPWKDLVRSVGESVRHPDDLER